jgi:putative ABC transport system permease protein
LQIAGGERPQSIVATTAAPEFFSVVGVAPEVGRAFTAEECQTGRDDVIVLSYGYAQDHFGSAAGAVGQSMVLNNRNHRVIGVMPASFVVRSFGPVSTDAWMPLVLTAEQAAVRENHNLGVVARLKDGATLGEAQTQMNVISERLAKEYPEANTGWGAVVTGLSDFLVGDVRPALLTLLGAVVFVLLIACANTANLVLARTITRRKELAIRAALGASAGQVVRPVLVETTLLALAGGALGLLLAQSGAALIMKALSNVMPRAVTVELDTRVLLFTLAASVLTGLAAGFIASWRLTRIDLNESLKQGLGKTDTFSGGSRTRGALVAAEVAMSLMLLIGAGLMVQSLWALYAVDPGFVASNVTTMTVPVPQRAAANDTERRNRLYDDLLPQVRRLPRVIAAGGVTTLPLTGGGSQQPIVIEGRPAEVFALQPNVGVRDVTTGYLEAMRIPIIAGRAFEDADVDSMRNAVVISNALARQFWPGENPLGKRLRSSFDPTVSLEVVGIAGDVKERGLQVLEAPAMLYRMINRQGGGRISLVVRSEDDNPAVVQGVTRVLQGLDPQLTVRDAQSMETLVESSLRQHRFSMYLFVAMATLAFGLAAVGIYSVLSYTVRTRVQEIGIRMALGARHGDVVGLVVKEGMKPTAAGIVAGAFGAWLLSGLLSRLVFGVSTADARTYGVAVLLALVALLACLVPAYRATRVEPVSALRND